MPGKVSPQYTYPPCPSPTLSHHQTPMMDQTEWLEHSYPPTHPSSALHTEFSHSPTPTASAASSVLTSPISSPSSTLSPPPPSRCNPCCTLSLIGGLRSTPQCGPSMLKTVGTAWIEKHWLLQPKSAGQMNLEKLIDWNKSTLDAIKVHTSLCSSHPILICKSG